MNTNFEAMNGDELRTWLKRYVPRLPPLKKSAKVSDLRAVCEHALPAVVRAAMSNGETACSRGVPPPDVTTTWTPVVTVTIEGWTYNVHSRRVQQAWSCSTMHGYGPAPTSNFHGRGATQGRISLYSTKVKAFEALYAAVAIETACLLAELDAQLRDASAGNG